MNQPPHAPDGPVNAARNLDKKGERRESSFSKEMDPEIGDVRGDGYLFWPEEKLYAFIIHG